ncbi:MAG: hypothetical protein AAF146_14335 [Bacteroidota bacterium]
MPGFHQFDDPLLFLQGNFLGRLRNEVINDFGVQQAEFLGAVNGLVV